jgi:hypothetical protein
MEEVLRRGIFVQSAHQVGNGAVEILGLDHRCIEQQPSGYVLDGPRLVVGHALQHLELHRRLDAVLMPQQQAVGHVEEVVAGHPQPYNPRMLGLAAVGDHALEVGVSL